MVVKGYFQEDEVNYYDMFAPLVKHDTIRLLTTLDTKLDWKIFRFDVLLAFLNESFEEEIFVK